MGSELLPARFNVVLGMDEDSAQEKFALLLKPPPPMFSMGECPL